ncbi:MAG TPA: CHAD domain-containing protein [Gemmatimonadales bacterium]|nr:CHAD domain-containing protein [Gemmatimonadales bacterium]
MTNLPADLLGRPAAQSVRIVALGYLEDATRAFERTADTEDALALHDFRVALRRLRTTLRAYRPLLEDSVHGKPHKRLGEIADATNRVRDAEVALDWLRSLAPGMTPGERVGLQWLIDRIDTRRAKDVERCLADTRKSFTAAARKLHKGLVVYRQTVQTESSVHDESFAGALHSAALEQARELDQLLGEIRHTKDEAAHRARIAAKRLRYVVEPGRSTLAGGDELISRLKAIQDLLGELHDLQELEKVVRAAIGTAAAERAEQLLDATLAEASPAGPAPRRRGRQSGLVVIAQRIRAREADLFSTLRKDWLGSKRTWARDVEAVIPAAAPVTAVVPIPVASPEVRRWGGGRGRRRV